MWNNVQVDDWTAESAIIILEYKAGIKANVANVVISWKLRKQFWPPPLQTLHPLIIHESFLVMSVTSAEDKHPHQSFLHEKKIGLDFPRG